MRALLATGGAPRVELAQTAPEPAPRPDEALVTVRAASLNRGEVKRLEAAQPGALIGWDLAGEVSVAAADGSGPPAGSRVVGLVDPFSPGGGSGAWAQRAAVPTRQLATLPDAVPTETAATLPVAGLTALHSLDRAGFVLGRRVLVTGASGGVGRFGIQLAAHAGAHVTALARRGEGLAELGAAEVIHELADEGPAAEDYDVVLDGIGGEVLGLALQRVAPGGTVVSYASTAPDPVSYPARAFFARAPGARLYGFYLFAELAHHGGGAPGLARLAGLVADGRLRADVDLAVPWERAGEAMQRLLERQVAGKAVLRVD